MKTFLSWKDHYYIHPMKMCAWEGDCQARTTDRRAIKQAEFPTKKELEISSSSTAMEYPGQNKNYVSIV